MVRHKPLRHVVSFVTGDDGLSTCRRCGRRVTDKQAAKGVCRGSKLNDILRKMKGKRPRSAKGGRFVSYVYAATHPATTVLETRKPTKRRAK